MNDRKNVSMAVGFVLAVSLIAASLTAVLCWRYYSRVQSRMLGEVCREILQQQPEAEGAVAAALRTCSTQVQNSETGQRNSETGPRTEPDESAQTKFGQSAICSGEDFLMAYGYQEGDFLWAGRSGQVPGMIGFLAGAALFLVTLQAGRRREAARIQSLTEYLENVNTGGKGLLVPEEDAFSGLQDEIYKTVTALYQTRDAALRTRDNFAENLSNIAHQIKTPITSLSLSVQMLKDHPSPAHLEQISQQLSRLTRLEEALLLLSRIDRKSTRLNSSHIH